jgi:S1-C subfamily serine protease
MPTKGGVPDTGTFWGQILPSSILGFATLLFFMSIAAAFSGAALFAFYRFELDDTKERIAQVESEIADDVAASEQVIEEREEEALAEIEGLLAELEQFAASGQTIDELVDGVKESVYLVTTRDTNGQPSVATAFVLFSDSERSYLLTSFKAIEAATVEPGPAVEVRGGAGQLPIELASWDPERDLALLVAEENPNLPAIEVAEPSSVGTGDRLFAVSALGGQGASIVQGVVADTSADGIQHDVPVGIQFRGGPMLDSSGKLVAISSRDYAPLPFTPEAVFFGIPVRKACEEVVQCPTSLGG